MGFIKVPHSGQDRKQRRSARCPNRARVILELETLEERWLPNANPGSTIAV